MCYVAHCRRVPVREMRRHLPFHGIHDLVRFKQESLDLAGKKWIKLCRETIAGRIGGLSQWQIGLKWLAKAIGLRQS